MPALKHCCDSDPACVAKCDNATDSAMRSSSPVIEPVILHSLIGQVSKLVVCWRHVCLVALNDGILVLHLTAHRLHHLSRMRPGITLCMIFMRSSKSVEPATHETYDAQDISAYLPDPLQVSQGIADNVQVLVLLICLPPDVKPILFCTWTSNVQHEGRELKI